MEIKKMLTISKALANELYDQGKNEAPNEACGYLAGKDNAILKVYEMTNKKKGAENPVLDSKVTDTITKELKSENLDLLAIYYTHAISPARPSAENIKFAQDPNLIYVITSTQKNKTDINAYKIIDGNVRKEELTIEAKVTEPKTTEAKTTEAKTTKAKATKAKATKAKTTKAKATKTKTTEAK
jgi:[CysO sulfur-carrier protein]-S-L-cysteine hydrolase